MRPPLLSAPFLSGVGGMASAPFCILTVDGSRRKGKGMKNLVSKNELGIFADGNGVVKADSLVVAKVFEKRHDNVVRDIKNLDCTEEFRLLNFEESSYINAQGHSQPCYNLTRNGLVFLIMGYRGAKAAAFKEAYIRRFDEMEEFIKYLLEASTEFPLLTENILLTYESPKHYHFSNEADLLNRIVLGKTAKQVREENGLKSGTSIRPYLTKDQIEAIDKLQRVDIGLLVSIPDFQERKRYLEWYYMKKLQ